MSSFRLHVNNVSLFALLVAANCLKWAIFGKLLPAELAVLRARFGYTTLEFVLGLAVLYNTTGILYAELAKFFGLFVSVFLVKCFLILLTDRVRVIPTLNREVGTIKIRLAVGLVLLHLVEGLLIYQYFYDTVLAGHNILVAIFGFEILNHYPLLVLTSIQFALNTYDVTQWGYKKLRISIVAEVVLNFVRFAMACVFSLVFMYNYTFPVHLVPLLYASLRVTVLKTRVLVNYRKRELVLQKLPPPADISGVCIFCFDELRHSDRVRMVPQCAHAFHSECLMQWLEFSLRCPVCRVGIQA